MPEQTTTSTSMAANSLPSSSERSSSSALPLEVKEVEVRGCFSRCFNKDWNSALLLELSSMESDEEIRRVPEMGANPSVRSASGAVSGPDTVQPSGQSQRKRGRSPADKESKRLKRLLRNRVSAQQARERKKAYLNDLETRVKDLEKRNSELEERLSTLMNENQMLRHILKNTTAGRRGSSSNADGSL